MAAGDAQRVWFREMIERLRCQWHSGMSFDAIVQLRDELDAMLGRIRAERHIRPAVFQCPKCGHVGEGRPPHVSVRAMILSLSRFGFAPAEQTRALDRAGQHTGSRRGWIYTGSFRRSVKPAVASIHRPVKPKMRRIVT